MVTPHPPVGMWKAPRTSSNVRHACTFQFPNEDRTGYGLTQRPWSASCSADHTMLAPACKKRRFSLESPGLISSQPSSIGRYIVYGGSTAEVCFLVDFPYFPLQCEPLFLNRGRNVKSRCDRKVLRVLAEQPGRPRDSVVGRRDNKLGTRKRET